MKQKLRKALIVLLAVIFLGSTARLAYQAFQYKENEQTYDEAKDLVQLPDLTDLPTPPLPSPPDRSAEPEPAPDTSSEAPPAEEPAPVYVDPYADALRDMDFSALREVNSDVRGWILIPDTHLSYPLLQGEDNDFYLTHSWRKRRNAGGSIFLEHTNSGDLSDFNTIVYGHRMRNSSMFATLKYYKDQSFWKKHPYLYISDDNGSHRYEIFAAYEVSVTGETYRTVFSGDQAKQRFLDFCLEQSVLDTGVTPTVYDKVMTLSTCTGNGHATRWVVQARLEGEVPPTPAPEEPTPPDVIPSPDGSQETPDTEEPPPSQDIHEPPEEASTPPQDIHEPPDETPASSQDIPSPDAGQAAPVDGQAVDLPLPLPES